MDLCFIDPYNVLSQHAAAQTCSGLTARYYPLLEHHLRKQQRPEPRALLLYLTITAPKSISTSIRIRRMLD